MAIELLKQWTLGFLGISGWEKGEPKAWATKGRKFSSRKELYNLSDHLIGEVTMVGRTAA